MNENPELVIPRLRSLRYPQEWPDLPPQEKGVDVQLALGLLESVISEACDVAVLFSNDSDLLPVIEAVQRLKGPASIETAAWWADETSPRLRTKGRVFHHKLLLDDFQAVERRINYAHPSP